ncbi:MAG: hypothetical protein LBG08_01600 [Spirochaetaceae bacterium]|jgi:hypothetical protein|nr:hypothetical protein [Spirochaetaceae bacterium]
MKKALVVLLILAIAGGLFAQELTWSGAVKTGLRFSVDDDDTNGEDPEISIYNDDADRISRFDLNAAYTKDNYGLVFRLRTDVNDGLTPTLHQAYGWVTFLDGVVKTSAGKIADGTWGTGGLKNYTVSGTGLRLEVNPIEGLSAGLVLNVPVLPSLTVKQFFSEIILGAKYSNDLFWLAGAVFIDSTIDGLNGFGYWDYFPDDLISNPVASILPLDPATGKVIPGTSAYEGTADQGLTFQAGVGVTPIPGLAISAEAKGFNVSKFADYGYIVFDEDVSYKLLDDKLTVGINSFQYLFGEDWTKVAGGYNGESLKPYIKITPYVGYDVLDNVNVGIEGTIGLWQDFYETKFSIKPKITYQITEGTTLAAYYEFDVKKYKDAPEDVKSSAIQLDLIWTF